LPDCAFYPANFEIFRFRVVPRFALVCRGVLLSKGKQRVMRSRVPAPPALVAQLTEGKAIVTAGAHSPIA